jgi:dipeptidase E
MSGAGARRLLLVSNSTLHGGGYLDHCAAEMRAVLDGVRRVLFVPFALHDRDRYAATARERLGRMGFGVDSLHEAGEEPAAARRMVAAAEAVFTGGGNTFRLLATLYRLDLLAALRERALAGVPYLGASAGSNLACPTVRTTNDMPIVEPPSLTALGLVPFQINPHYLDPDPASTHQGETREERIREFLEENDLPVVGLREGAMLAVDGDRMTLRGAARARLFRRSAEPTEVAPGADLSFLLA